MEIIGLITFTLALITPFACAIGFFFTIKDDIK